MANWLNKRWIEKALLATTPEDLPKYGKAQVIEWLQIAKSEECQTLALLSDNQFTVKAHFTVEAVQKFNRERKGKRLIDIKGGLISVKQYRVEPNLSCNMEMCDFLVVVEYFRFAGAEGNEPFEENLISCACHAPFVDRLRYLWRMEQLRKLTRGAAKDCDVTQILQLLARESRLAFIPPEQEEALQNIPEFSSGYQPPQSCGGSEQPEDIGSGDLQPVVASRQDSGESLVPSSNTPPESSLQQGNDQLKSFPALQCLRTKKDSETDCSFTESQIEALFKATSMSDKVLYESPVSQSCEKESIVPSSYTPPNCSGKQSSNDLNNFPALCFRSNISNSETDACKAESNVRGLPGRTLSRDSKPCSNTPQAEVSSKARNYAPRDSTLETEVVESNLSRDSKLSPPCTQETDLPSQVSEVSSTGKETADSGEDNFVLALSESSSETGNTCSLLGSLEPLPRQLGREKTFEELFSQNTWDVAKAKPQISTLLQEEDRWESIKRRSMVISQQKLDIISSQKTRLEKEDVKPAQECASYSTGDPEKQMEDRLSAEACSPSQSEQDEAVKSARASDALEESWSSNSSANVLAEIYSQQSPLVLDMSSSSDCSDKQDLVLNSVSNASPNTPIDASNNESPLTFPTPNFSSLPSHQPPKDSREFEKDERDAEELHRKQQLQQLRERQQQQQQKQRQQQQQQKQQQQQQQKQKQQEQQQQLQQQQQQQKQQKQQQQKQQQQQQKPDQKRCENAQQRQNHEKQQQQQERWQKKEKLRTRKQTKQLQQQHQQQRLTPPAQQQAEEFENEERLLQKIDDCFKWSYWPHG